MARIRVVTAASIDGFLPERDDKRMEWLRKDRRGLRNWHERCERRLYAGYPLVDLICEKEEGDQRSIYLAEITEAGDVELLRGLFLYHIVDEMVIYLLPLTRREGVRVMDGFTASQWETVQMRCYRNGICRIVYRKVS
jgi:hypothetical protein